MWFEAGLHVKGKKLNFFGDMRGTPWHECKHPEAMLAFSACGMVAMLLGIWGLAGRRDDQPVWWNFGIGLILFPAIFGWLFFNARYINGTPFGVIQPGFYLAMMAMGGLAAVGVRVFLKGK